MSQVILHHYQLSPYSEKIRLALGLKDLNWRSVEIPVWTPRPNLTPMTGGYRRTPNSPNRGRIPLRYAAHSSRHREVGWFRHPLSQRAGRPRQGFRLVD